MPTDGGAIVPRYVIRKVYHYETESESRPIDWPQDELPKPKPDAYGVYENQTDGTQQLVDDHETLPSAQKFVDAHAGETVRIP